MLFQRLRHSLKRWWRQRKFSLWYDPSYRLPITSLAAHLHLDPRRAEYCLWYLFDIRAVQHKQVHTPSKVSFRDLALVHECSYLESLNHPEALARIFTVDAWDIPTAQVIHSIRMACGGTLDGARFALKTEGIAFNLLGGFHHASPHRAGPLCPVHDIAVAIAVLRREGFQGQVAIIDLDAHPPDGTEDCLKDEPRVWMGSLSGTDWGPLPHTDETVLPGGCDDQTYLTALKALLERMPRPDLAFVIAGGDVLANDHMGGLGLTLAGVRQRDIYVDQALAGIPSVWVPGGGYHSDAWKVLAGTGIVLTTGSASPIPPHYQPLAARYDKVAEQFDPSDVEGEQLLTEEDFSELFGFVRSKKTRLFLGYYTAPSIEYGLYQYGILDIIKRLGYDPIRIELDHAHNGDRFRLYGMYDGTEHLLVELVAEKAVIGKYMMLYIHWLTLRNPRAEFSNNRPQLPGQEAPGLGLAKESSELLRQMAKRLALHGVAFQPAWFHIAYAMRRRFAFSDPERQGRFEALIRDLADIPLLEATLAIDQGRVLCNGQPYTWESGVLVSLLDDDDPERQAIIDKERERTTFTLLPTTSDSQPNLSEEDADE